MSQTQYLGVISPAELETVRKAQGKGRRHPLVNILLGENEQRARFRLESAARLVSEYNLAWLQTLKSRLTDIKDYTEASGAIGELRAYGALLETWMNVKPGPTVPYSNVVPEFGVDGGDGEVIVEVHTRQLSDAEAAGLEKHDEEVRTKHKEAVQSAQVAGAHKNVVTIGETEIFPTGRPDPGKPGDTWVTNTISRIASIKEKETQIDPEKPFVLWLDLHDQTVWGFPLDLEFFRPLFSEGREGYINSGPFWFALYGKKGDPLLYSQSYDYRSHPLLHDGRFFQTIKSHKGPTRISAVVFSTPDATIIMENPEPKHSLPSRFRASFMKAPRFCLDRSIMEWSTGLVAKIVEQDREMVHAAASALRSYDAAS
jgi:hypothetical protein